MLNFYNVDAEYVDYLRQFDDKVPHIKYEERDKFVCGIVLNINGCDYFAPVSSKIHKQQTAFLIKDKDDTVLSAIKFNFMFPAPQAVVTRINITDIRKQDASYANLLQKEYAFCKANESAILAKAKKIYAIGCNPRHFLHPTCCDFQSLEKMSKAYFTSIMDEAFAEYDNKHAT